MSITKRYRTIGAGLQLTLTGVAVGLLLSGCGSTPPANSPAPSSAAPPATPGEPAAPSEPAAPTGPAPAATPQTPAQQSDSVQPTQEVTVPYNGPPPSAEEIATREAQLRQVNPREPPFPGEDVTPGTEQGPAPGSETNDQPTNPTP